MGFTKKKKEPVTRAGNREQRSNQQSTRTGRTAELYEADPSLYQPSASLYQADPSLSAPDASMYEPSPHLYGAAGARHSQLPAARFANLSSPQESQADAVATEYLERGTAPSSLGPLRQDFDRQTGLDTSRARVVQGNAADAITRRAGSPAVAHADHLYFRAGALNPATPDGRHIIAHELAHAGLHGHGDIAFRYTPQDVGELPTYDIDNPPPARVVVGSYGLGAVLEQPHTTSLQITRGQLLISVILAALVPDRYSRSLVDEILELGLTLKGGADPNQVYNERLQIRGQHMELLSALGLIHWLTTRVGAAGALPTDVLKLSETQFQTLRIARSIDLVFRRLRWVEANSNERLLPKWMGPDLFQRVARLHADESGALNRDMEATEMIEVLAERQRAMRSALELFYRHLLPDLLILEAIRRDTTLAGELIYRVLFNLEPLQPNEVLSPASGDRVDPQVMGQFISFFATQPGPWTRARDAAGSQGEGDTAAHRELLERFQRHYMRTLSGGDLADEDLSRALSDRNAPALPISITAAPQLSPPLYDLAAGADHRFVAQVSFADAFDVLSDAFGGFIYNFEARKVPQDSPALVRQTAESEEVGQLASNLDVLGGRLRRQARYLEQDLERVGVLSPREAGSLIRAMELSFGAPFNPMTSFVAASNAISAVGTVFSTTFDLAATPRSEALIQFDEPGMYVVCARVTPRLTEDSEYRRSTGLAWMPVYVRPVAKMAELRTAQQVAQREAWQMELADIELRLAADQRERDRELTDFYSSGDRLSDADRAALEQRAEDLHHQLHGSVADVLGIQRRALAEYQNALESEGGSAQEARRIGDAITQLDKKIANHSTHIRGRDSERLTATFVSDAGQVVQPMIEVVLTSSGDHIICELYDFTRGDVGYKQGYGTNRKAAIHDAVETYFESWKGFGRGQISVFIPFQPGGAQGEMTTLSIEGDLTQIGMTAIENITLITSLVAIAAAPFTGGASLMLMVPVGLIGALPAAYRLADRGVSGTFELNMATAMDIVDVIGGVIGLAELRMASAGATRALSVSGHWTQRGLMISGLGSDGLGVMFMTVEAIDQLSNLPDDMSEGERRAVIMQVVANSMMTLGMQAGGALASHASTSMQGSHYHLPEAGEFSVRRRAPGESEPHTRTGNDGDGDVRVNVRQRTDADVDVDAAPSALRRTSRTTQLESQLPAQLRGMSVVEDASLGAGISVDWQRGPFGMVREISIRVGPDAARLAHGIGSVDFRAHVAVAEQMHRYTGISGMLRTLRTRVARLIRQNGEPPVGSRLWELNLEVSKLSAMIEQRMDALASTDPTITPIDRVQIDAQLTHLRQQEAKYRRDLENLIDEPARGYVAAELPSVSRQQQEALLESKTEIDAVSRIPRVRANASTIIEYGALDALGRATGIVAVLDMQAIQGGSAANRRLKPPGFLGGSAGHARGHLLGRQLGGSGNIPENLVTLYQNPTNSPVMRDFETKVRNAVETGETVEFWVTPIYDGTQLMPVAVQLEARGSNGFFLGVSVINQPNP